MKTLIPALWAILICSAIVFAVLINVVDRFDDRLDALEAEVTLLRGLSTATVKDLLYVKMVTTALRQEREASDGK